MRIFGPEIIGAVTHKADAESPNSDVLLHDHPNKATLDKFSVQDKNLNLMNLLINCERYGVNSG